MYPSGHLVGVGVAVVVVEDEDGRDDGRRNHEHDAVEVGAKERHGVRRRRHRLRHHVQEDGEREEYRHPQGQLLAGVGRQREPQHRHGCYEHAGHDQVEEVVQRAPPYYYVEGDVYVRLRAAVVVELVPLPGDPEEVPLPVRYEAAYVAAALVLQLQVQLQPVVRPTAELHLALLVVEREPRDVDLAGALEDTRRHVHAAAVVPHHHVGGVRPVEPLIRAAQQKRLGGVDGNTWVRSLGLFLLGAPDLCLQKSGHRLESISKSD